MNKSKGAWIRGAGGAAAGALMLYFVFKSTDWKQAGAAFSQAGPGWLIVATAMVLLQFAVKGLRLMALSDGRWHAPSAYTESVALGLGVNSFIPLRAGEFLKIAYMVRHAANSILQATLSVVVERILDVAFMAGLLFVTLGLERGLFMAWFEKMSPAFEGKASAALIAGSAAAALGLAGLAAWFFDIRGLRTRFAGHLRQAAAKLQEVRRGGGHRLTWAVLLTLAVWGMDSIFLYSMTRAFDLGVAFRQIFFLQVALTASYASSVSPGALGLYEFLGLWALKMLGKPEAASLACLLAAHGLIFAAMGAGVLYVTVKSFWLSPKTSKKLKETVQSGNA